MDEGVCPTTADRTTVSRPFFVEMFESRGAYDAAECGLQFLSKAKAAECVLNQRSADADAPVNGTGRASLRLQHPQKARLIRPISALEMRNSLFNPGDPREAGAPFRRTLRHFIKKNTTRSREDNVPLISPSETGTLKEVFGGGIINDKAKCYGAEAIDDAAFVRCSSRD